MGFKALPLIDEPQVIIPTVAVQYPMVNGSDEVPSPEEIASPLSLDAMPNPPPPEGPRMADYCIY